MLSLPLKAATSTIVHDEPVEAVQATLGMFVALAVGGSHPRIAGNKVKPSGILDAFLQ